VGGLGNGNLSDGAGGDCRCIGIVISSSPCSLNDDNLRVLRSLSSTDIGVEEETKEVAAHRDKTTTSSVRFFESEVDRAIS
jgi:hypothetical protein